jgi:hypothetical protein
MHVRFKGQEAVPPCVGIIVTVAPKFVSFHEDRAMLRVTEGDYPFGLITVPIRLLEKVEEE